MPPLRQQRVRAQLKRILGEIIRRDISIEQAGLITINDVGVSRDLHSAVVYLGVLGTRDQQRRAPEVIQAHHRQIQLELGKALVMKYTPKIRFIVDDSVERGNRILHLIEEIEVEDPDTDDNHEDAPEDH